MSEREKIIPQVPVGLLRSNGHFVSPNKINPAEGGPSKAEYILRALTVKKFLLI